MYLNLFLLSTLCIEASRPSAPFRPGQYFISVIRFHLPDIRPFRYPLSGYISWITGFFLYPLSVFTCWISGLFYPLSVFTCRKSGLFITVIWFHLPDIRPFIYPLSGYISRISRFFYIRYPVLLAGYPFFFFVISFPFFIGGYPALFISVIRFHLPDIRPIIYPLFGYIYRITEFFYIRYLVLLAGYLTFFIIYPFFNAGYPAFFISFIRFHLPYIRPFIYPLSGYISRISIFFISCIFRDNFLNF